MLVVKNSVDGFFSEFFSFVYYHGIISIPDILKISSQSLIGFITFYI